MSAEDRPTVGKVVATSDLPASPHQFHFWTANDTSIGIGAIVRVDGVSVPTTFVDIRTLKARIPASVVARALPNRFNEPGPFQLNGVYGDRTVKITVFNRPPDGGTSNSVSLRVQAKWLRGAAGADGLAP